MNFFKFLGIVIQAITIEDGRLVLKAKIDLVDFDGTQIFIADQPEA